jgi:polyhydroxybutyrate depolymerase
MQKLLSYILLTLSFGLATTSYAQQTLNETIIHDSLEREYILYIPEIYTGEIAVPLVFNFHGLTQYNDAFMNQSDFRTFADSANFIVCYPQGTVHNGFTHWNVGTSEVDDIGFTNAMIDAIISGYNVDTTRVYSTGYSNGAYMSYLIACELSQRFAAIAPVKGKLTEEMVSNCLCEHQMPVLAFNNTNDFMVSYNDDISVEAVIDFWVDFNSCNLNPTITELPDIYPNDNIGVEHIVYTDGDNGVNVELIRENDNSGGWGHNYPASSLDQPWYFDAPTEIWNFFSKYDINGLINQSAVGGSTDPAIQKFDLTENFPNPFNPSTTIKYSIPETGHINLTIFNINGSLVDVLLNGIQQAGSHEITFDGSTLVSGTYFYQLQTVEGSICKKMILVK